MAIGHVSTSVHSKMCAFLLILLKVFKNYLLLSNTIVLLLYYTVKGYVEVSHRAKTILMATASYVLLGTLLSYYLLLLQCLFAYDYK